MSGEVDLGFSSIASALPHINAGKIRALAISSSKRSPAAPDIPTIEEVGFPGFRVDPWHGVFTPTGTPKEIVSKLNAEINKIVGDQTLKKRLSDMGIDPNVMTPEQFGLFLKEEMTKWAEAVKYSGAKFD